MSTEAAPRPAVGLLHKMIKKIPPQLILLSVGCQPASQGLATTQLQSCRRRLDYSDFSSPSVPSPLKLLERGVEVRALPATPCAPRRRQSPADHQRSADAWVSGRDATRRVSTLHPAGVAQRAAQVGGIPHPPRPQLKTNEGCERLLGRTSGRSSAAYGLGQGRC